MATPPRPQKSLYEILQVERTASGGEIKRAYHRLALRYHPDKESGDAEVFKEIQRAYDVLSVPEKRQVYDQYGPMGLEMLERAPWMNPDMLNRIGSLSILVSIFFSVIVIQLAFLCMRVDQAIEWDWNVVFIPIYIIVGGIFLSSLSSLLAKDRKDENDDATSEERNVPRTPRIIKLLGTVYVGSLLAMTVLIPQIVNQSVPAWTFAIPYVISECFHLARNAPVFLQLRVRETALLKATLVVDALFTQILRVTQISLILAHLTGAVTASWAVVFIPAYLYGLPSFLSVIAGYLVQRAANSQQGGASTRPTFKALVLSLLVTCFTLSFYYITLGLVVAKLMGSTVSLAVALVPVWIILTIMICVTGCVIPCASMVATEFDQMPPFMQTSSSKLIEFPSARNSTEQLNA